MSIDRFAADNQATGIGVVNTYGQTVHYLPIAGEQDRWLVVTLEKGKVCVACLPWTRVEVRRDIELDGGDILYDEEGLFPEGTAFVAEAGWDEDD